jgi:hypothetical protein
LEISNRVAQHYRELRGQDAKLAEHRDLVAARWPHRRLKGDINILCSDEVEFVTSADPAYWLDSASGIPRICVPEEHIPYLNRETASVDLQAHPRFIHF